MRIISWNINGIGAHIDALVELVGAYGPDLLCLQKVRSTKGVGPFPIEGYSAHDIAACRSRHYGVATYCRYTCTPRADIPDGLAAEGHFQAFDLPRSWPVLFNVYVPFSNTKGGTFIEERRQWDDRLCHYAAELSSCSPLVMCGDFNVVDQPCDTWTREIHQNKPCYYPWERANFGRLMQRCDLVDAFRELHPGEAKFTYFDSKGDYRASNQGDRIDYFLVSRSLLPRVSRCDIIDDITASNSNPIILDIEM